MTLVGLRVLREVAERGTFTAAAEALGYTQSAVSRQVATLEQATGARLFDRYPGGVRLTSAGQALLRHAVTALEALEAADRELRGAQDDSGRVRLGFFPAAGAAMVARALATLRHRPQIQVSTREGTTPSLARALRTGALDLAVLSSRPPHRSPDTDDPPLHVEPLLEDRLVLAVPAGGRFADGGGSVTLEQLAGETWIASPAGIDEPLLGVWPGLPGRPRVRHATRDWLTKLHLVAAGAGITTVPSTMLGAVPPGVRLVSIEGVPEERRRVSLVRLPGPGAGRGSVDAVVGALRGVAGELAE